MIAASRASSSVMPLSYRAPVVVRYGQAHAPNPGADMTDPTTEPELSIDEYIAQLRALEAQYPPPTWAEVMPDWKWLHEGQANNTFDPEYKYGGLCVAIYNRQVVGTDTNRLRLRLNKARELGIHPERLVITTFYPAD